jgi:hypothetical protein
MVRFVCIGPGVPMIPVKTGCLSLARASVCGREAGGGLGHPPGMRFHCPGWLMAD